MIFKRFTTDTVWSDISFYFNILLVIYQLSLTCLASEIVELVFIYIIYMYIYLFIFKKVILLN